jgi:aminotransferase
LLFEEFTMTTNRESPVSGPQPARRLDGIELSLIRQINALATPLSINLGIGEPNVAPDEQFLDMARRAATTSWSYSPNAGALSLRKKLCEGTSFDPKSEVCVTAGTQEALFAIFTAFVDAGDEVLVPNPGFLSYATLARVCGATIASYAVEPPDWQIDVDDLERRITSKTKLVIVNTPSNPLGAVASHRTLERIAGSGVLVVSDEIYREIWYDEPPASMLELGPNVLTLNGLSKSHSMTGLRLGWIHGHESLMKPIITAHQYIATCASVFSQALAEMILDAREWNAAWLSGMRAQFAEQRAAAMYAIEHELEVRLEPPRGAFYAFAPVPACDTISFAKALATDAAVLVIPGLAFGTRGQGFIRISYAAPVEQITGGIERVGQYLRSQSL